MSKSRPAAATIHRLADVPAYASLVARQAEVGRELDDAKAELAARQRPAEGSWREAVAAAIADGKPAPPRPTVVGASELAERVEALESGAGLLRERLRAVVDEESRRIWGETIDRRARLVHAMHDALEALVAATREYDQLRAEYEAAGVKLGYVLSPIPLAELESALHEYVRRAPDQASH
jgi:hypothetical protein